MTITAERLRELLSYDPDTGVFTRRVRTSNRVKVGDVAGSPTSDGYLHMCVGGRLHLAHRLAWLYVHGEWPSHDIDHRNTVRSDNRIDNLRLDTKAQNPQNHRRAHSQNKCGLLGVSLNRGRWRAQISAGGRVRHIGLFDTPELAHAAYLAEKAMVHPFQTLVAAVPA